MRAPIQKLIRRPSRSVPSVILALLLLTADRQNLEVDAFVRYRISPEFSVQANLNNLLDKKYLSQITGYGAYGDGRNGSLTFTWAF